MIEGHRRVTDSSDQFLPTKVWILEDTCLYATKVQDEIVPRIKELKPDKTGNIKRTE